jgi:hypothetical protein
MGNSMPVEYKVDNFTIYIIIGELKMKTFILAYLDPGTGSLIFQLLIAAGLGLLFRIKILREKIKAFFSGLFNKSSAQ